MVFYTQEQVNDMLSKGFSQIQINMLLEPQRAEERKLMESRRKEVENREARRKEMEMANIERKKLLDEQNKKKLEEINKLNNSPNDLKSQIENFQILIELSIMSYEQTKNQLNNYKSQVNNSKLSNTEIQNLTNSINESLNYIEQRQHNIDQIQNEINITQKDIEQHNISEDEFKNLNIFKNVRELPLFQKFPLYNIVSQYTMENTKINNLFGKTKTLVKDLSLEDQKSLNIFNGTIDEKTKVGINFSNKNSVIGYWNKSKVDLIHNIHGYFNTYNYIHIDNDEITVGGLITSDFQHVFQNPIKQYGESDDQYYKKMSWIFIKVVQNLLKDLKKRVKLFESDFVVLMSYPDNFTAYELYIYKMCMDSLSVGSYYFVSESLVSLPAYYLALSGDNKIKQDDKVFTFDMGSSTLDMALAEFNNDQFKIIKKLGVTVGGNDFDYSINKIIVNELKKQVGKEKCIELFSKLKYRLRSLNLSHEVKQALAETNNEVLLLTDIDHTTTDIDLSIEEFEKESSLFTAKIQNALETIFKDAIFKDALIDPRTIDHVLMVGGSVRTKSVKKVLKAFFGNVHLATTVIGEDSDAMGCTILCNNPSLINF